MVQTTPASASVGGQLLQELEALNQALYQAGQCKSDGGGGGDSRPGKFLARRETMPARFESEREEAEDSLGILLRSSHPRPPVRAKSAQLEKSLVYMEHGLDRGESRGFEESYHDASSLPESLEENVDFRQRLEAGAEKKKGLWSWKPFRALAHVGQQKFNCMFTVHVHAIEGLPASVNGLRLGVHFARKDDVGVQTVPARVSQGYAEFQETLNTRCSVHGTKNGAKGMKWESKQFILSVIALDVDELLLGRHKLELTRLLPETIEDDVEKLDTWTTSFKLSGKAQGGTLIVTFGCEIQSKDPGNLSASSSSRCGESPVLRAVRSFNSLPNSGHATPSRYASEDYHSPAMSEPSAEYHMEHLSLDDFNHASSFDSAKGSMHSYSQAGTVEDANFQLSARLDLLSKARAPVVTGEAPSEAARIYSYEELNENLNAGGGDEEEEDDDEEEEEDEEEEDEEEEEEEDDEEEELQFTVVEQGVELGTIVDNVSGRGYDAFESEHTSDFGEKVGAESADVSTQAELYYDDVYEEAEDQYDVNEEEDEKEELRRGAGGREELEIQVQEYLDSENRSIDDELEMQELLAALGEQERDPEGEEGTNTPNDLQMMTDYMAEEELLSLLPAGTEWESAKKVPQSKVLESDDEFDDVAGEFLSLLGSDTGPSPETLPPSVALVSDSEPDSPRALLLKQFEKEAMIESGLGLNMKMPELQSSVEHSEVPDFYLDDMPSDRSIDARSTIEPHNLPVHQHTKSEDYNNLGWGSEEDVELASIMEAAESELQKATQTMRSKTRAKMLEDEETEALMQEWGLNKKVFEGSPHKSSYKDDTGNPYAMVSFEPPPLGFGLGSTVPVRDGGSLTSMNPVNFQATSGSKLVMQVSKPVVVPTEPGANPMDLLLRLASSGMDGMTDQAMLTMPLDDITGKSVEQIASEGFAAFRGSHLGSSGYAAIEGGHSPYSLEYPQDDSRSLGTLASRTGSSLSTTSAGRTNMRQNSPNMGDDTFMSLEDLAPMAMQKIEALALEGLKIQADMAEEEAPYVVEPFSSQERPRIEGAYSTKSRGGKSQVNYLEDSTSMRVSEDGGAEDSGIGDDLSMAISLDEWMRLDAGLVDDNDITGNTMALVAAHQATHGDIVPSNLGKQGGKQNEDGTNEKTAMGNTITLAMLVQLRDPLRNFEPIGAPMMALVQAERFVVPPMPKLRFSKQISLRGNNERYDDGAEARPQPLFKITDVTLSGLKLSEETANDKKNQIAWGNPRQQQSGSRWLVASGMSKNTKNAIKSNPTPFSKSTSAPFSKSTPATFSKSTPAPFSKTAPAPFQKSTPAPFQKSNPAPFQKSNPVVPPEQPSASTKTSKIDSLWSLSAKFGSRWGGSASKTRNPDVAMPTKTGWFGRKK